MAVKLSELMYADDIVLITETQGKLLPLTDMWIEESEDNKTEMQVTVRVW